MHRHVFWDLGGTLVDTYPPLDAAFVGVLARHGHRVDPQEVAQLTHESTGRAVRTLAQRYGVPAAEFERANTDLKRQWEAAPPPAMPGAQQLMRAIHAAGGLNLVVTHRDRGSAEALIEGLGLPVDDLVSTSDGFPRKPDPTMYRVLLERHALDPRDCLAVGDRQVDVDAAHRAGMHAALLATTHVRHDGDAEHVIGSLDELRPLLGVPAS